MRCQKLRRKRYASGQEQRGRIRSQVSIDDWPRMVEQSAHIGDWEAIA
ncbi:hypothetical protein [Nitrosomonas communis]|nr:hypothetical protein [Nitrosomonas communis]